MADDAQQLYAQYQQMQQQLQQVDQRLQQLEQSMMELQQAEHTLEALQAESGVSDVLVPVGGGVHLRARVDPSQEAIVPIGGGYAAEDSLEKAAAALDQRMQETRQQLEQANKDAQRLGATMEQVGARIQASQQEQAGSAGTGAVAGSKPS